MQNRGSGRLYAATDLVNFLECEHLTSLDLINLQTPLQRAEADESTQLIQQKGYQCWCQHRLVRTLEGVRLDRCECGARLAGQPANTAAAMIVDINRVASGFATPAPLPSATPAAWFRAIALLGQAVSSAKVRRPGNTPGLNRLQTAQAFVSAVASVFDDWPCEFDAVLLRQLLANAGCMSIQRTFDPLYRILYKELRSADFGFMRDAFESFLHEHWWGLICRRNRRLAGPTIQDHPRVTSAQAAAMVGISQSVLNHMVQCGCLSAESALFRTGRRVRTLHVDDLRMAASEVRGACTLTEAAKLLALAESRVRQLIDAGAIATLVSRRSSPMASRWLIASKELKRLSICSVTEPGQGVVTLRRILRYGRLRAGEIEGLVAQVLRGAFRPSGMSADSVPLGSVLLDRAEAQAWLASQRDEADMSIDEAGKRLGMKQQVAYALANAGLLTTNVDAKGRRRVTRDDLAVFGERYVSLSTIARGLGTSPRAALGRIQARPVCGPGIDTNRQYFYRRAEIVTS